MSYIPYTANTSLQELSSSPSPSLPQSWVLCSLAKSLHLAQSCRNISASSTQHTERTTGFHLMRKSLQQILQAAWSRKGKLSPGIRRSLIFYSLYMEMVVLVLGIDLPCLCFLVTSSSCSVPSLFSPVLWDWDMQLRKPPPTTLPLRLTVYI